MASQSFQGVTGTTSEHQGDVTLFVPCFAPVFASSAKTTGCSLLAKHGPRNPLSLNRITQRRKLVTNDRPGRGALSSAIREGRATSTSTTSRTDDGLQGRWLHRREKLA